MSKVFIEENTLSSIGNAIREKNSSTELISPLDMATAITNIPTGSSVKHVKIFAGYGSNSRFSIDLSKYISDINQIIFMVWPNYYSSNTYGGFSIFSPAIGPKVIGRNAYSMDTFTNYSTSLDKANDMVGGTPTLVDGIFTTGKSGYLNCICGYVELFYV